MSHKADPSFFEVKKPWSRRKDTILEYYLDPYLAKVNKLGRPILLVDGFAGPGRFGDGSEGSPLIPARKAMHACVARNGTVRVWCIEPIPELYEQLKSNLSPFPQCTVMAGRFEDHVEQIAEAARSNTTFLYLDPWTVSAIEWATLDALAKAVLRTGASIELLLNFNTPHFVRWGLSALALSPSDIDMGEADEDETDTGIEGPLAKLSSVVGGDWWMDVLRTTPNFVDQLRAVMEQLHVQLRWCFSEVGALGLKRCSTDLVPKYHMLFASRHADALLLMNEAMIKARGESDFETDLFAAEDLDHVIADLSQGWIKRRDLVVSVMRKRFCAYAETDIRKRIWEMVKSGRMETESGTARLNKDTRLRYSKPQQFLLGDWE